MNIIEAVKSRKRFRRMGMSGWCYGPEYGSLTATIPWSDIIANDWEVEEKKVEITRDRLFMTINKLCANALEQGYVFSISSRALELLSKELGLE